MNTQKYTNTSLYYISTGRIERPILLRTGRLISLPNIFENPVIILRTKEEQDFLKGYSIIQGTPIADTVVFQNPWDVLNALYSVFAYKDLVILQEDLLTVLTEAKEDCLKSLEPEKRDFYSKHLETVSNNPLTFISNLATLNVDEVYAYIRQKTDIDCSALPTYKYDKSHKFFY